VTRLVVSTSEQDTAGPAVSADQVDAARQALRQIAAAVTVLTISRDGLTHGTTVSAMSTMSRRPLVLGVCLRPTSKFAAMIQPGGLFSVNVLTAGQQVVARRFADRSRPMGDAQFAGLERTVDELTGAPLISGCLAYLACRATDRHRVGDHDLLLAEVVRGTPGSGTPLVSFSGRLETSMAAVDAEASPGARFNPSTVTEGS
jgi:flavin reductase (DIM6/NTAB) family NADH-FMN oxidoreductase RutF